MAYQAYKITRKRTPELHGRKVKRTGRPYYEVAYYTNWWNFKEFDTLKEAKEFVA